MNKIWQSIVGGVTNVFKNNPKDWFAAQALLEHNVNDVETGISLQLGM